MGVGEIDTHFSKAPNSQLSMAGFLLPAEAASSSSAPNELQQMQIEEPPPSQFIVKESAFGSVESSPPLVQIPIVDVSLVFSSQDELEKLKNALSSWGCFQVGN